MKGSSARVLCAIVILAVGCSPVLGALTEDQEQLKQDARNQAAALLGDASAESVSYGRAASVNMVASRIEFYLNRQAASMRWADAEAPPVVDESAMSRSELNMTRTLKSTGCDDSVDTEVGPGRGLLAFRAWTACKTRDNVSFGKENSLKFKKGVKNWQECCKLCSKTQGCVAWTLNAGDKKEKKKKRGCYLKRKGYGVRNNAKGYISGTMASKRDVTYDGDYPDGFDPSLWDPIPDVYENPGFEPTPEPIPEPTPPVEPTPPTEGGEVVPPPEEPSPPVEGGEVSPPPVEEVSPPVEGGEVSPPVEGGEVLPPPVEEFSPSPFPEEWFPPIPVYGDTSTYKKVLGLSWKYFEAQRSGKEPSDNRIDWRGDSHVNDPVAGGVYDAGDYLKLNFPLAPTVGYLAWGLLEFKDAYEATGEIDHALSNLKNVARYLRACLDIDKKTYIGQIGDPDIDHNYWGRPEQQKGARPAFVYKPGMGASDLYGAVSAALSSSSMVFAKSGDSAFAASLLAGAKELYKWGSQNEGKYSAFYKKQTFAIYPSSDWADNMAWAAGWMYRATGEASYLDDARSFWGKSPADVYPGWDSLWAPHAIHMINLADKGIRVPGIETYRAFGEEKFLRAWIHADGFCDIISTPKGMHYPKWNEWANLQFSTTSASLALFHAKYTKDATKRYDGISFAQKQVNYALGVGSKRSYVVGFGNNPPTQPHHAAASCPSPPASCSWDDFEKNSPNPHVLTGALVAGPAGVRKNAADPDDSYKDKRSDYITNEVANDYNAGFTNALAGLSQLLNS